MVDMRRTAFLAILAVLPLSLLGCRNETATKQSEPSDSSASIPAAEAPLPSPKPQAARINDKRPLIVCFGDSLTAGYGADPGKSYPDYLQADLDTKGYHYRVVNEGISGNRVLYDGSGASALARFDRDVLSQAGVKWVMLLEGINDIGQGARTGAPPENAVTADDLIQGMTQLIERAHMRGIKVIGCTLTVLNPLGAGFL